MYPGLLFAKQVVAVDVSRPIEEFHPQFGRRPGPANESVSRRPRHPRQAGLVDRYDRLPALRRDREPVRRIHRHGQDSPTPKTPVDAGQSGQVGLRLAGGAGTVPSTIDASASVNPVGPRAWSF